MSGSKIIDGMKEAIAEMQDFKERFDRENGAPCPWCSLPVKKEMAPNSRAWTATCICGWQAAGMDAATSH